MKQVVNDPAVEERILETELHRFVRFNWEIVTSLARANRGPVQ